MTIISFVWTLSVKCKALIEGVKNIDGRSKELERRAHSFTVISESIRSFKDMDKTDAEAPQIELIQKKIWTSLLNELRCCQEDFKAYDKEISRLLERRKSGNFGVREIAAIWREVVAIPIFERIEKGIADHELDLLSLLEIFNE